MINQQTATALRILIMFVCLAMFPGPRGLAVAQAPPSSDREVPPETTVPTGIITDSSQPQVAGSERKQVDQDNVTRLKRIEAIQARLKMIQALVEESEPTTVENAQPTQNEPAPEARAPFVQNKAGGMAPAGNPAGAPESTLRPNQYQNASESRTLRNASTPPDLSPNDRATEDPSKMEPGESGEIPMPPRSTEPLSVYELANSLYLSGNWRQALPKYKEYYDANQPASKEDVWLKMALASCVRMQGDSSVAESIYRELIEVRTPDASQTEESQTSVHARWFLKQTGDLAKMKQELEALDSEFDTLQKTGDDQ